MWVQADITMMSLEVSGHILKRDEQELFYIIRKSGNNCKYADEFALGINPEIK